MPTVLIADKLSPAAVDVFRQRGVEADVRTGLSPEELKTVIADYDGLAIRSATKVTAEVLDAAARLKVVGRAGIGVDNVDVPAASSRGVVVMNTPFGNAITTAEHAIALMFALARQIPRADASTRAGKWEKSRFMGVELHGKTLGIIGCGNIGSLVASRAIGVGMRVIVHDPYLPSERAEELCVERVELEELLRRTDFISLHVPSTEATRHMIDAEAIAQMKRGVRIINCARGGLIVEDDLKTALESGHVAGVALDVFATEPARDNVLFGVDNVVCTPHLGASTNEAQEKVALQVAEQMADFLLTGAVVNAINMPSVSAEEAVRLRPYLTLAEHLGGFAGQITESAIRSVRIVYEGEAAELNVKPLNAAILAALLRPLLDNVNMVSAPVIARSRGIEIEETRHAGRSDYQTLIRLVVTTEKRERSVCGTLFGGNRPRIVEVEGIPLEAELTPLMLFVRNEDKPGLIGGLGTVLGEAAVNIASFHLGRKEAGQDAVALIAIDHPLPESVIDTVRALPSVVAVRALRF